MDERSLLVAALLACGSAAVAVPAAADMIQTDSGIAVKQTDVATPARGMTKSEVASKFGAPAAKVPAVGSPPISRWEYPSFVVYFEGEHVIHSVIAES